MKRIVVQKIRFARLCTWLSLFVFSLLLLLAGCHSNVSGRSDAYEVWKDDAAWYQHDKPLDETQVDVFYVVSTEVAHAEDEEGNLSLRSLLTADDRAAMEAEMAYVLDQMFYDDFNYFSPYYHQYTFESFVSYPEPFAAVRKEVRSEVTDAFSYYMEQLNGGRRFILAGFSQGGEMVVELLRQMRPEWFERMVAAYVIGFELTADDLRLPYIRAAKGETDTQVAISFNSVLSEDGIWPFVSAHPATCINPLNWRTDTTPATMTYEGQHLTVSVDSAHQVLMVTASDPAPFRAWMQENPVYSSAHIHPDCLHHWDLLFYTRQLHDNAVRRAYGR